MPFKDFVIQLKKELERPLPGEAAQFVMAPYQRSYRAEALGQNPAPKKSAVLILIYPVNEIPFTLLMLRKTYPGVHSGQVSFPGGKMDEADHDLSMTALREAEEETGVNKNLVTLIGKLTRVYIPPSGFLVQPFIGYLNEKPMLLPDRSEVEKLIETPLDIITRESTIKIKDIHLSSGLKISNMPYFDLQGETVWGATAMMLGELKAVLHRIR